MSDEKGIALINPTRLLFELQKIDHLNQSLSNCLEPEAIANKITGGLVEGCDCAFARIWLVTPDFTELRLVASSGLYTRLNGDFARVPMGAYKVGKIAQHCIPFLSNSLAEESWVKDREWAIANKINGFAGLPLAIAGKAIGVLAIFSHQPMGAEFLEALRILCSSVAVALNNAQLYQQELKVISHNSNSNLYLNKPISEQISSILANVRLILMGTERPLTTSVNYILLRTAEALKANNCSYCRLTYESDRLSLEAMLVLNSNSTIEIVKIFEHIGFAVNSTGGNLQTDIADNNIMQVGIFIPYANQSPTDISLSHREQEVVELLARGLRDREIAQKLYISDRTVKFHINNVLNKLNARTRIQAIYRAYQRGFLGLQNII
ncbi:MAG: LuxR C-terminal-related transcriptional regulator [Xenococcaceae cyanobacterium MO_188.B29]|nr:LuxR C-terminal-related transcriptional regulator [Xenococcaceae cyanobacterium MO_188.B29]